MNKRIYLWFWVKRDKNFHLVNFVYVSGGCELLTHSEWSRQRHRRCTGTGNQSRASTQCGASDDWNFWTCDCKRGNTNIHPNLFSYTETRQRQHLNKKNCLRWFILVRTEFNFYDFSERAWPKRVQQEKSYHKIYMIFECQKYVWIQCAV